MWLQIFKIAGILLGSLVGLSILYLLAIYPLIRAAPPIKEYEMTNVAPIELEERINRIVQDEGYVFNPSDTIFDMNDDIEETRYITLSKDSIQFIFRTQFDEIRDLGKLNRSYITLNAIFLRNADSMGNRHYQFNTYDDSLKFHKVFEKDFLSRIGEYQKKVWYKFW